MVVLQQMAVLFILMLTGYVCRRLGYINDEVDKKLSAIVVNVANPAVIISGCITENRMNTRMLVQVFIVVILIFAALLIIAQVLPVLLGTAQEETGIYRAMTVFSNMGFMGIPMANALYGSDAIIYMILFTIPFNILIYTYGVLIMTNEHNLSWKKTVRYMANTGVCASIIAIVIYLTGYKPPMIVQSSLNYIGNLVAPLSMMLVGASFAGMHVKKMLGNYKLLIFSIVKMIIIPVIFVAVLKLFVTDMKFLGVCMIVLATPVGTMTAMLAKQYHVKSDAASEGIALTTLMSLITIPLVSIIVL